MQKKIRAGRALLYIILVFWAVFMIMPFAWMLLTSVKTQPEAMKVPIVWLPKNPQWKNYVDVLQKYRFASYYKNTAFVTVTTVVFQLMTCSMGAYAFARLDFPGKNAIFLVCMTVLMVPTQMIIIPRFIMTMRLGWLNSFAGIIIPNLPSIYGVFFLRQNFMTLPRELDEAAMINGCSFFGIYWRILLPLLKNGLIAFGVRTTLWSWNEILWPLIVTSKQSLYVLSIALANMQGQYAQKIPTQMAAGVLAMAPMLLVFLIGQKQMLEGIALSSIKA